MGDSDGQISVELIAKIDQLLSGMAQGKSAVQDATGSIAHDVHDMAEAVKHEEGLLHEVLSGALFLEFKEIAKEALEGVKEAFESTVGKAEEFGLANAKFAAIMHTSEEDAAGLAAALHGVGSSSEAYESIALRLQKTVQAGSTANKELTEQFKDQEGHVLTGTALMERLKEVLGNYTEESQNAIVVQLGLGRRASDLYDVLRVGNEDIEHQKTLYKSLGVDISGTSETSKKLEEAMNDLHTMLQSVGIALGQELMPVFTSALTWMSGDGKVMLEAVVVAFKGVLTAIEAFKVGFVAAVAAVTGAIVSTVDALKGFAVVTKDALTGNWSAIEGDFKGATTNIKADWAAAMKTIEDETKEGAAVVGDLWNPKASANEANVFKPKSGKGTFTPQTKGKGGADKGEEADIAAEEKLGLASIAIAEKTSQHLLALGQETTDAFLAQQRHLEDLKFAIEQEALDKELQVHGKSALDKEKTLDKMQELQLAHEGKLLAITQHGESMRAQESQKATADYVRDQNERLNVGLAAIQREFEGAQITAKQRYAAEVALTEEIKGEEMKRLDAELATLEPGTKAFEQAYRERERIVKDSDQRILHEQEQLVKSMQTQTDQWVKPMTSAFSTAINDMTFHAKSFADAMKQMGVSILEGFASMLEKMAEDWLVKHLTMATVKQTIDTTSAATAATNAATADAAIVLADGTADRLRIAGLAAVAAAGAYASEISIPYVGPAVAAAAAAESEGVVMGFQAAVPMAAGGMTLDRDQLVFAHKQEMILPAHISQGLLGMIDKGGGGGGVTLHYEPTLHGSEARSLAQLLKSESGAMMAWLSDQARSGALRRNT